MSSQEAEVRRQNSSDPGPRVSAIIPTRNEEENLRFLLPTLAWCAEIVVVDQQSADRTREIARAAGARIVEAEKRPDFDAGRALGAEIATCDWLLTLDADEMIPPSLAAKLLEAAGRGDCDIVGIPRLNYLLAPMRGAGMWPDTQYRFFRRGAIEIGPEVHTFLALKSDRVLTLPADPAHAIHHFAYRDARSQIDKLNHYTELETRKEPSANSARKPVSSKLWRNFCWEPVRVFLSRYIKQRGFRQGIPGLWVSAYWSFYYFAKAIKMWEKERLPEIRAEETRVRDELLAAWRHPPGRPTASQAPQ